MALPLSPFNSYLGNQIPERFFPGVRPKRFDGGAVIVYDETQETFDKHSGDSTDVSESGDTIWTDLLDGVQYKVFISGDGDKLMSIALDNSNGIPRDNEVFIFIEGDEDVLTDRYLRIKAGDKVELNKLNVSTAIERGYPIREAELKEILSSARASAKSLAERLGNWLVKVARVTFSPNKFMGKILGKAIEYTETLLIDEKYWNPDPEAPELNVYDVIKTLQDTFTFFSGYLNSLKQLVIKKDGENRSMLVVILERITLIHIELANGLLHGMEAIIKAGTKSMQDIISILCGLWNGIVEMFTGLFFLVKVAVELPYNAAKTVQGVVVNRRTILEILDNAIHAIFDIKWSEVFATIWDNVAQLPEALAQVPGVLIKEAEDAWKNRKQIAEDALEAISTNRFKINYYIGYVATWVIPIGFIAKLLGKVGTAGKAAGKVLVWVDKLTADILRVSLKGAKAGLEVLADLFRKLVELLKKGTAELKQIVNKIFKRLREWIDEVIKKRTDDAGRRLLEVKIPNTEKVFEYFVLSQDEILKELGAFTKSETRARIQQNGVQILKREGELVVYYADEILERGDQEQAGKLLDDILKSAGAKKLDEGVAAVKRMNNETNKEILLELGAKKKLFKPLNKKALKKLSEERGFPIDIPKSELGFVPDYATTPQFLAKVKGKPAIVRVKLTPVAKGKKTTADFNAAWEKLGVEKSLRKELSEDYTWHHLDDYNPITGEATLQLVETRIHEACYPHVGSAEQARRYTGVK